MNRKQQTHRANHPSNCAKGVLYQLVPILSTPRKKKQQKTKTNRSKAKVRTKTAVLRLAQSYRDIKTKAKKKSKY